jgi:hypothetical protein
VDEPAGGQDSDIPPEMADKVLGLRAAPEGPWCMKAGLAGSLIRRMAQHAFFLDVWNPVHAVQTSRRRPSPHSAAEVPDHELAGVGGWPSQSRQPDGLVFE